MTTTVQKYRITSIGKEDVFYDCKKKYIGATVSPIGELTRWSDTGTYYGDFLIYGKRGEYLKGSSKCFHSIRLSPIKSKKVIAK